VPPGGGGIRIIIIMLISTALLLDSNIRNSVCTPAKLPCRRVAEGLLFYNIFYTGNGRTEAPQKTGKFVGLR
jgi:hypothetical protein